MQNNPSIDTMKINCVVVTYNRIDLLKENLAALKAQTYPIHKIFIINNHSTDETEAYLSQFKDDSHLQVCNLEENIGGVGGFSYGIKQAVKEGCDYVWLMDDDTIPGQEALERLVEATALDPHIGFVCSKVVWTDGSIHKMNKSGVIQPVQKKVLPDNPSVYGMLCNNATFVSSLFKTEAIYKVGLPYKEFFIWHDDIEYTERITQNGYVGYYVEQSVVTHKTHSNYAPRVYETSRKDLWKFYYQARNTTFLTRQKKANVVIFYFSILNKYRNYLRRIKKMKDKEAQKLLKKEIRRGCLDGLKFRPRIEYLDSTDSPAATK